MCGRCSRPAAVGDANLGAQVARLGQPARAHCKAADHGKPVADFRLVVDVGLVDLGWEPTWEGANLGKLTTWRSRRRLVVVVDLGSGHMEQHLVDVVAWSTWLIKRCQQHVAGLAPALCSSPLPLVVPLEVSSDLLGPSEGGDPSVDNTTASRRSPRLETLPGLPPRPNSPPLQPVDVDPSAVGGGDSGGAGSGDTSTGAGGARGAGGSGAGGNGAGGVGVSGPGGFGAGGEGCYGIGDTGAGGATTEGSELQKRHMCTDLGELTSYLGLRITRDKAQRTITLTQSHMVQQFLQRFDFTYSSPQSTPLPTGHSLSAPP
ncbi:unnamed protein product [Closterium sp. NIES-53]